jgi:hypothetical protein
MSRGIDYGGGLTNIDPETGIRFGVINANALTHWFWEEVESDYGPATCGKCGSEAVEYDDEKHGEYPEIRGCCDYACETCGVIISSDEAFGDEPIGHHIDDGEIKATVDSDGDVFVLKSPFFTRAQFCSPCAPGACHLENPTPDGEKAYCFGHEWFEEKRAPYAVYRVDTGEDVKPTEE